MWSPPCRSPPKIKSQLNFRLSAVSKPRSGGSGKLALDYFEGVLQTFLAILSKVFSGFLPFSRQVSDPSEFRGDPPLPKVLFPLFYGTFRVVLIISGNFFLVLFKVSIFVFHFRKVGQNEKSGYPPSSLRPPLPKSS